MKIWAILIFLLSALIVYSSVTHIHGIVGMTKLNGEGCVCHNLEPVATTQIRIFGPDSVIAGSTVQYIVKMTGLAGITGGFNVAARAGILSAFDSSSLFIENELTHRNPKAFIGDTVSWIINYKAPVTTGWDTLYSAGLCTNNDSIPTEDDKWNFTPNFPVKVVSPVPVELSSFSVTVVQSTVVLKWVTATEANNKGFEILRVTDGKENFLTFIPGSGSSVLRNEYLFTDKQSPAGNIQYILKQIDYDGTFASYRSETVQITPPNDFTVFGNYPNPFNPSTSVSFCLPAGGFIKLEIYNSSGELVSTPKDNYMEAGYHTVMWKASEYPSGVYMCKVSYSHRNKYQERVIKMALTK